MPFDANAPLVRQPRTGAEAPVPGLTDTELNEAWRAAHRAVLTRPYAMQAEMDEDGRVSLLVAPADADGRRPAFVVDRTRPDAVRVTRIRQGEVRDLGELGTVSEAVWLICHHARYDVVEPSRA